MWIWLYLGCCLGIGAICTAIIGILRHRDRHMLKGIDKVLLELKEI